MSSDDLVFNGINAATGQYLLPPVPAKVVAGVARGQKISEKLLDELRGVRERAKTETLGPAEGVDPTKLEEAGWGVIFADDADPALREALQPLLDHRGGQAAAKREKYYREFWGPAGYHPDESKQDFLSSRGAAQGGPANPERAPYYLLIAGDPRRIPYTFQYQLDVQYAVGRIHFDTPEEYHRYAVSVVQAETAGQGRAPRAAFFGVQNPEDRATRLSAQELVRPLAESFARASGENGNRAWEVRSLLAKDATKAQLCRLLGGPDTPALLFSASHGVAFPNGDPLQLARQGALLCQDWPGPIEWGDQPIPEEHYFSADDVPGDARLLGLIAFFFACFGAGTPEVDEFAREALAMPAPIAPHPFLARLPQRLLSHPAGGALAVVGHVDRAWGYSFAWENAGRQVEVFESALRRLLKGHPVGSAFEYFNERYAELASDLADEQRLIQRGKRLDEHKLAGMWTASNDARGYMILGDPAVRLLAGAPPREQPGRPVVEVVAPQLVTIPGASGDTRLAAEDWSTEMAADESELLFFNGINGTTADYFISPLPLAAVAAQAKGEAPDPLLLAAFEHKRFGTEAEFAPGANVEDVKDLAQAGWSVIFAHDADPAVVDFLRPLLKWRKEQAESAGRPLYHEFLGEKGFNKETDTSKEAFLKNRTIRPTGAADPKELGYYVLIVGDPEVIPFSFQFQLDVVYAVGRIYFENAEDYGHYADSVIRAEKGGVRRKKRAVLFGVQNPDDGSTDISWRFLIKPLRKQLLENQKDFPKLAEWTVDGVAPANAFKSRLTELVGGADTPALLLTASHGMQFNEDDSRLFPHQGALLCQDWPGPREFPPGDKVSLPDKFYFSKDDVSSTADVHGLIAFHFACLGAGTPRLDDLPQLTAAGKIEVTAGSLGLARRKEIAPRSFVASLPQRLLGHPKGGALAVISHVDRALGSSFSWRDSNAIERDNVRDFYNTMKWLMTGYPVGAALDFFGQSAAELSSQLNDEIRKIGDENYIPDDRDLALRWIDSTNARGYIILGDPAVRAAVGAKPAAGAEAEAAIAIAARPFSEPVPADEGGLVAEPAARLSRANKVDGVPAHDPERTAVPAPATQPAQVREAAGAAAMPAPPAVANAESAGGDAAAPATESDPAAGPHPAGPLRELPARLAESVEDLFLGLNNVVRELTSAAASLEVTTYVSDDMASVEYTAGKFTGSAARRAMTVTGADGAVDVCVAAQAGKIDEALWAIHRDSVRLAQEYRAEMLKAIALIAGELARATRGDA